MSLRIFIILVSHALLASLHLAWFLSSLTELFEPPGHAGNFLLQKENNSVLLKADRFTLFSLSIDGEVKRRETAFIHKKKLRGEGK